MNFLSWLVRTAIKLVLFVFALMFALGLLCVGLVILLFVLLKALLTGRKPAFITTYTLFRQASQQFKAGPWQQSSRNNEGFTGNGEVIEGEAIVISNETALPSQTDKP